jgi:hypothetical protein
MYLSFSNKFGWLMASSAVVVLASCLLFAVVEPQGTTTNIPPGVSASLWIPLSENSGIALDTGSKSKMYSGAMIHGVLMTRINGKWMHVSLESEPGIMPLMK